MCDYSLEMYASRAAQEGENYVTTRFPSGSIGLTTRDDCKTAICVKYDTRLRFSDLSKDVQMKFDVGPVEDVLFIRREHGAYHDGVKFSNGRDASLQEIGVGVGAGLIAAMKFAAPPFELESEAPAIEELEVREFETVD